MLDVYLRDKSSVMHEDARGPGNGGLERGFASLAVLVQLER